MNKLLVSDVIDLKSGSYVLECQSKNLDINIDGDVTIYLLNEKMDNISINVKDNNILHLYMFNNELNNDLKVIINQNNNSKVYYNESYLNSHDRKLIIDNNMLGSNNESIISIRNISNKGDSSIIVNVLVDKKTINNIALESIKGINNGGYVHVEPNIICLSNEVSANHLTTIGSLDPDSINYLVSKGISLTNAQELLLNGFIYSNMDEYIKKNNGGE